MQASLEAADEIGMAVIATTFALVAVFLPTAFMGGIPGKFFKQFGWTAVLAILASLLVARLLTPMMCAYLLKAPKNADVAGHEPQDGAIMRRYLAVMQWCLRRRGLTMLGAAVFFAGSLALVPLLPTGFMPPADRSQTQVNVELAPGATLAQTRAVAEQVRLELMKVEGVTSIFSSIGGGSSGDAFSPGAAAEARRAVLTVKTVDRGDRDVKLGVIENTIRDRVAAIPGARFTVGIPDAGTKMQLVLRSEDANALSTAARQAERELRGLPGIGNVSSSASLVRPEIIVRPDFSRAPRY
jgi:multidrug efflux pump subunit AcrB